MEYNIEEQMQNSSEFVVKEEDLILGNGYKFVVFWERSQTQENKRRVYRSENKAWLLYEEWCSYKRFEKTE
jgi:hypothetical protein